MSIYPSAIDGYEQLPLAVDGLTKVNATSINNLRAAILNIETTLGTVPNGEYESLSERLQAIEETLAELREAIDAINESLES